MRIVIDMQGAQTGSRHRGIGRYTIALAQAMMRHRGEHEIILLLNGMFPETLVPIRTAFHELLPSHQICVWNAVAPVCTDNPANTTRRHIAEVIREDFIRGLKPDVLYITSLFEGFGDDAVHSIRLHSVPQSDARIVVTFYDVIPLIQKETYLDPNPHFQKPYYEKIEQIKSADLLLAISESSRQEAIENLKFNSDRVVNMSSAVDDQFCSMKYTDEENRIFKSSLGVHNRFIMYSGATDERKNHLGLITAYAMLPAEFRSTCQLVLVGGLPDLHRQNFEQHIKQSGLSKDEVIITGRVSDESLVHAYNICDLYVFPSWHEGFGLPALEALACGAPVIGANTTSIPEVIGIPRALFDPYSPRAIADKIEEVFNDPTFLAELKANAPVQAAKFSWDESAKRALRAIESMVHSDKSSRRGGGKEDAQNNLLDQIVPILAASKEINLFSLAQVMARNVRNVRPQLLVDVSELVRRDSRSGIQRVVRSILQEWLSSPPEQFDLRLVYGDHLRLGYRYANRFIQNFLNQGSNSEILVPEDNDLFIDFNAGDIFVGLDMQHEVQIFQGPFYQHMRAHGVDVRFVVYDLLPLTMPQYFPPAASANHALWITEAAKSDGVVCISQAVANDFNDWIARQHPLDAQVRPAIQWFHLGADIESSLPTAGLPANADIVLEQLRGAPSFLMVGTLEPRKGHDQVLQAFCLLWEQGLSCNLVLVGRGGWGVDHLPKKIRSYPEYGRALLWLDSASDEYLEKVYAASTCLVAASYGEGFGLPLIEAAQHKLPIIARDIPVFREVAGEHAYYFNAAQPDELARVLRDWLALYRAEKHPRSDAMPWLTWQQSATQLAEILLKSAVGMSQGQGATRIETDPLET